MTADEAASLIERGVRQGQSDVVFGLSGNVFWYLRGYVILSQPKKNIYLIFFNLCIIGGFHKSLMLSWKST
jgi:hypothetical protein